MKQNNTAIAHYYDNTTVLYKLWTVRAGIGAMHYGIAEPGQSFSQALINTNRYLAHVANITPKDRVLDAGCGIGGSALWLADIIGCSVTGISLSKNQIKRAKVAAAKRRLTGKVEFAVMDYAATTFPDASFDVVWGLESICHAKDKAAFFHEAFRLLKPGGRLVIGDGFALRKAATPKEVRYASRFEAGFVVPPLATPQEFETGLRKEGFAKVVYRDKTANILSSGKRMYAMALLTYPFIPLMRRLHFMLAYVGSHDAAISQYHNVRSGLYGYGVCTAHKS